jgi:hypothetical protein
MKLMCMFFKISKDELEKLNGFKGHSYSSYLHYAVKIE